MSSKKYKNKVIADLIKTDDYSFLDDPRLKGRKFFYVLGGSHAYGTNIPTSDIDLRGVYFDTMESLCGLDTMDTFSNKKTDTQLHSLTKFVRMLKNNNPSIMELLFCEEEQYYVEEGFEDLFEELYKNRSMFLSKRCLDSFGGYANAQLKRIENGLVNNGKVLTNTEIQDIISDSINNALRNIEDNKHFPKDVLTIYPGVYTEGEDSGEELKMGRELADYIAKSDVLEDLDVEVLCDINLKGYPLRLLKSNTVQFHSIASNYKGNIGNRNIKKDDKSFNKHMMHLVRLLNIACDILEYSEFKTKNTKILPLLMDIRNGKYRSENGGMSEDFIKLYVDLNIKAKELKETSTLPNRVQDSVVNPFIVKMMETVIKRQKGE